MRKQSKKTGNFCNVCLSKGGPNFKMFCLNRAYITTILSAVLLWGKFSFPDQCKSCYPGTFFSKKIKLFSNIYEMLEYIGSDNKRRWSNYCLS